MILKWEDEIYGKKHSCYVLKRQSEKVRPFLPPHIHDYCEIFFVQKGDCICSINNVKHSVSENQIIFTRPETDRHCIESHSENFEIIQLMFEKTSYYHLRNRYSGNGINSMWDDKEEKFQHIYDVNPLWFESNYNRLLTSDGSLFELEHFLINLLDILENQKSLPGTEKNDWLDYALGEIRKPENFRKGVKGFVSLCNRTHEHIERKIKKKTGYTISQLVNRERMSWASYMLVFTDYSIQDISLDCGFKSSGQFYSVFKKAFRESPDRFRKAKRNLAGMYRGETIEYLYNPFILMEEESSE